MAGRRILVIEDDPDLASIVAFHLNLDGNTIVIASTAQQGLEEAGTRRYDLIVLDVMLPDGDGFDLCRRLRDGADRTPVVMLTARDTEHDCVLAFDVGADDYLIKPFRTRELVARVSSLLRRTETRGVATARHSAPVLRSGALAFDCERRTATLRGAALALTGREFDLLLQFARCPGRVFRRSQLIELVWGAGQERYGHTVNSLINRLRAKVEDDPQNPACLVTEWGIGYVFHPPSEHSGESLM